MTPAPDPALVEELAQTFRMAHARHMNGRGIHPIVYDDGQEAGVRAILARLAEKGLLVPDGWVAVPEKATPEMLAAFYKIKNGWHPPGEPPPRDTSDAAAYAALLAARPKP